MAPDYVCLSPLVGTPEPLRIEWSLRVEAHLKARNSLTQLHRLATTGDQIMRVVDWRSVDSTAWIRNAGMGVIFVEHDDHLLRIPIGRHGGSRRHFDLIQDERLRRGSSNWSPSAGSTSMRYATPRWRDNCSTSKRWPNGREAPVPASLPHDATTCVCRSPSRRSRDNRRPPPGALAQTLPCMSGSAGGGPAVAGGSAWSRGADRIGRIAVVPRRQIERPK